MTVVPMRGSDTLVISGTFRSSDIQVSRTLSMACELPIVPAGIVRVEGAFARGDAVIIRGPDGAEIGRGLSAYDADDAEKIRGRSSADIASILGFSGRTEMVHRDDLVVGQE